MLSLTGVVSYVWIGLLAMVAVGLFTGTVLRLPTRRMLAGSGSLVLLSVIIHLLVSPTTVHGFPPGGAFAAWVGEISRALFHNVGSVIIFMTAFVALLMVAINRSVSVLARTIWLMVQDMKEDRDKGKQMEADLQSKAKPNDPQIVHAISSLRNDIDSPAVHSHDLVAHADTLAGTIAARKPRTGNGEKQGLKTRVRSQFKGLWGKVQNKVGRNKEPIEAAPLAVEENTPEESLNDDLFVSFDGPVVPEIPPELPGTSHRANEAVGENPALDTDIDALVLPDEPEGSEPLDTIPQMAARPQNPFEDLSSPFENERPRKSAHDTGPIDNPFDNEPHNAELEVVAEDLIDVEPAQTPTIPEGPATPEPKVVESDAMKRRPHAENLAQAQSLPLDLDEYELPSLNLLDYDAPSDRQIDEEVLKRNAQILVEKLAEFKVECTVDAIRPGPVITTYEVRPASGVKISKIGGLADDLAMALQAERIRILAPIPGRDVVGIEIPNGQREIVYLKEILGDDAFQKKTKGKLPLAIGKDVFGQPVISELGKMPHLLVAGATGSGKSVGINTFIMSLLYNSTPDQVRMIMVDPKMLELSIYDGIPHLLLPVVTDANRANLALRWAVREMERRYKLLKPAGVRNIDGYNKYVKKIRGRKKKTEGLPEHLPYIVVILDELADLMMVAGKDVETSIARLAQMARAAGIHLVVATQRPSVDVITGLIKANFPSRMSFKVSQKVDSRTILDQLGAERLLGLGDMLFLPPGASHLNRIHGAYVSDEEVQRVVDFIKKQSSPRYDEAMMEALENAEEESQGGQDSSTDFDPFYDKAVEVVARSRRATISYLQRELGVGYNRSSRIMEQLEREGVVGAQVGTKPREILVQQL
jgi:S-DNA-T family DNA segregation ATPase FtsK/SpoIIIE